MLLPSNWGTLTAVRTSACVGAARVEELLRPGASAASARFCARLRRDSYARVSLPPDASALLLRAQA